MSSPARRLKCFLAKPYAEEHETMVLRHRNVLELLKESGKSKEVDAVYDQVVFTSPSNLGRQVKVYPRREPVLANSMSDGRKRDHAVSISYSSARTEPSGRRVGLSIMGGGDEQMNRRFNKTRGGR
jgi:hypothetical protein